MTQHKYNGGFTIVELLIVVVVIAILAAITIVSYNGISSQAKEAALKSELSTAAKQLGIMKVEQGSYPSNASTLKKSDSTTFSYTGSTHTFCLSATSDSLPDKPFKITEAGSVEAGECSVALATTMQTFTPAMCSSLETFTGTNNSAVITLTDSRGGTTRSYQVAKLADGKCWMLNNLKLGSTTGAITLTSADSDVASNFTLPQVTIPSATDYDNPQAIGPVPGDTGSGATNYGYLYNWSAATAGESRTSHTQTDGDAPYSICPAGWKLPIGGEVGQFAMLNAKMNNPLATSPSASSGSGYYQNWRNTGPLKGVFSGSWGGSFDYQGLFGNMWSRSARPSSANNAFNATFGASSVYPGTGNGIRYGGLGVRCLLN